MSSTDSLVVAPGPYHSRKSSVVAFRKSSQGSIRSPSLVCDRKSSMVVEFRKSASSPALLPAIENAAAFQVGGEEIALEDVPSEEIAASTDAKGQPDVKRPSLMDKFLGRSSSILGLGRRSASTATKVATVEEPAVVDVAEGDNGTVQVLTAPKKKEQVTGAEDTVHHSQHNEFEYYVVRVGNRDCQSESKTETRPSFVDKLMGRTNKSPSNSSRGSQAGGQSGRRYITPIFRSATTSAPALAASAVEEPVAAAAAGVGGVEVTPPAANREEGSEEDAFRGDRKEAETSSVSSAPTAVDVPTMIDETAALHKMKAAIESGEEEVGRTVFLCGLTWGAGEPEVRSFFKGCGGTITKCTLITRDGLPCGNALVTFETPEGAKGALKRDGKSLRGSWMEISLVNPPKRGDYTVGPSPKPEECHTVFVGNLSWLVDEDSLNNFFSDCGEVSNIRFATDLKTGYFLGFGHVEFVDSEATDKAVAKAGREFMGRDIRVDYAADQWGSGIVGPLLRST